MMRVSVSAFLALLLLTIQLSAQTINSITPQSAAAGDPVKVEGTDFCKDRGKVIIGGKEAKDPIWDDKLIVVLVPQDAQLGKGDVVVKRADDKSASHSFEVKPRHYDQSAFEVLTGVGAVLAGLEATSYKTDNDALSSTNVGRKTPELLLGGGFIMPFRRGGRWIEKAYCGSKEDRLAAAAANQEPTDNCRPGGAYDHYRPWETFVSIRFAPASDQTINGFVVGAGYRVTKYFSVMVGYSVTPVHEPSPGFRVAAAQIVTANPTISPYNRYNPSDLLHNKPGAFDGFPLFIYDANGVTTKKLFPSSPTVDHHRSGIFFGVGIPLNLTALFKPSGGK